MTNDEAAEIFERVRDLLVSCGDRPEAHDLAIAALRQREAAEELAAAAGAALEVLGAKMLTAGEVTESEAMHFQIVFALTAALAKYDSAKKARAKP